MLFFVQFISIYSFSMSAYLRHNQIDKMTESISWELSKMIFFNIHVIFARIKDLAKVSHILTNVPVGSDSKMEALAAILMELETSGRQKERRDQPAWLLHTAVALTQCCVYPHWLLQEVFGDKSQRYFNGLWDTYFVDRAQVLLCECLLREWLLCVFAQEHHHLFGLVVMSPPWLA